MKRLTRSLLLRFCFASWAVTPGALASIAVVAALFGPATVGHAGSFCANPTDVDCGAYCCPEANACYLPTNGCCDAEHTVPCPSLGCCRTGETCNPLRADSCCTADTPVPCSGGCCAQNTHCSPDGNHCLSCPANKPLDCGNGFCCPANGHCMPGGTCGCPSDAPVQCESVCCPTDYQCSADGTSCIPPSVCSDSFYRVDCQDNYCCPVGSRCGFAPLQGGDVLYRACCIDLPEGGCCHPSSVAPLAASLGSTTVKTQSNGGNSTCRKSTKVRPFEVLQVSAGSAGVSFDTANHAYSVGFAVSEGRKSGHGAQDVLKVPVITDDSNATSLSVMIPPYLLKSASHGTVDLFLVTDGVMSDTCISRVRIAKLPKSASKVPGLVTLSWLRANETVYSTARPALASASAAPYVHPDILADVDATIRSVGDLIPSFTNLRKGPKPLIKTARQSDTLLTGLLTAGAKVGDAAFASASTTWLQAMSKAKDGEDASLKSAEVAYASALLTASGASAQSVAKFTVACGSVTTAGIAASATLIARGGRASGAIDAKATANVICGATVTATAVVCGVTSVAARAATPGATAYGKALLKGSVQTSASTAINYAGVNLGTAKVCGCREPALQGVVTISITIINICDHIRRTAPTFCLPDEPPVMGHGTTTTTLPATQCGQQQNAGGTTSDTRVIALGRTSGTFTFDYRTFVIKDHIIVSYEGRPLLDTGCVATPCGNPCTLDNATTITRQLSYSGSSTQLTVQVMAVCDNQGQNLWDYTVHCPQ